MFNCNKQTHKYLSCLPSGKVYAKAYEDGSNFNKIIKWLANSFLMLCMLFKNTLQSFFVCEKNSDIRSYMLDYNMPNAIFYDSDDDENRRDLYVQKYLMRGNTAWHFYAIASIYNITIRITPLGLVSDGIFALQFPFTFGGDREIADPYPIEFPFVFGDKTVDNPLGTTLVIEILKPDNTDFAYDYPIKYGDEKRINKIKTIYDIIKEAQTRIIYEEVVDIPKQRIDLCVN